jgi:A/G-specific adenine glycosylase
MKKTSGKLLRFTPLIKTVWSYYDLHRRSMRWRDDTRPYYIVVSEIMLQQTQAHRVAPKFDSFVARFPDWSALAQASNKEVIAEWTGLGYNRRALYLKRIAEQVTSDPTYKFMHSEENVASRKYSATEIETLHEKLLTLPGIGPNTAGSILAFAFNIPFPFIETNIRSVFIYHFFPRAKKKVSDVSLHPLIEEALRTPRAQKNPREWYYALMNYGSYLKKSQPNPSRKSVHHVKQKAFKGSNRELRSKLLQFIMKGPVKITAIRRYFLENDLETKNLAENLSDLQREGFLASRKGIYSV